MYSGSAIADHGSICCREIQSKALNLTKASAFVVCNRILSVAVSIF